MLLICNKGLWGCWVVILLVVTLQDGVDAAGKGRKPNKLGHSHGGRSALGDTAAAFYKPHGNSSQLQLYHKADSKNRKTNHLDAEFISGKSKCKHRQYGEESTANIEYWLFKQLTQTHKKQVWHGLKLGFYRLLRIMQRLKNNLSCINIRTRWV